jgi:hypothetical protein
LVREKMVVLINRVCRQTGGINIHIMSTTETKATGTMEVATFGNETTAPATQIQQ